MSSYSRTATTNASSNLLLVKAVRVVLLVLHGVWVSERKLVTENSNQENLAATAARQILRSCQSMEYGVGLQGIAHAQALLFTEVLAQDLCTSSAGF